MQAFTTLTGLVAPLERDNVDTDMIIPKQFLKSIKRSGFGPNLFDELRYLDEGQPDQDCSQRPVNSDFMLNQPRYQKASVLLAGRNFGCGSSREHAPWALLDYGFRCIIAPSFADIFYNNCFKNGILPVVLPQAQVDIIFLAEKAAKDGLKLTIDLQQQLITLPDGQQFSFNIDKFRRNCLLQGLDEIGLTLQQADAIKGFEARHQQQFPWLFAEH
ncbi:3-isopropylmalate dehydratase small subunit [Zooshikella harenae]|uniref:3-isopropylmalate dehydratase small subunit n=1 Tax=Zooshikella harenae TaxID=2827238 RepID=A0ABS5ZEJ0_9GAMM|nr:3-isopropylmalate dehydratase small subunit [Zooshikella harenae]MBU2712481.1 3-isopropylmalate dehydratase small subunit [Zooshikella harenae]